MLHEIDGEVCDVDQQLVEMYLIHLKEVFSSLLYE